MQEMVVRVKGSYHLAEKVRQIDSGSFVAFCVQTSRDHDSCHAVSVYEATCLYQP